MRSQLFHLSSTINPSSWIPRIRKRRLLFVIIATCVRSPDSKIASVGSFLWVESYFRMNIRWINYNNKKEVRPTSLSTSVRLPPSVALPINILRRSAQLNASLMASGSFACSDEASGDSEWSEDFVQEIMLWISNGKFKRVDFDMSVLHHENRGAIALWWCEIVYSLWIWKNFELEKH